MSTFADLANARPGYSRTCPRCGDRPTAGSIEVRVNAKPERGESGRGPKIASKSKTLCEPCAVEVYEATVEALTATGVPA